MLYLVFASHASNDKKCDSKLEKFLDDLRTELDARGASCADMTSTLFVDSMNISTGEEWLTKLSHVVATSPVCLAIYSPHFYKSVYCGKEVAVFIRRYDALVANGNGVPSTKPIIPVLWVDDKKVPAALSRFQYRNSKEFPKAYRTEDLRTLFSLRKYRDARQQFIIGLVKLIVDAAAHPLPAHDPIDDFDRIANAFEQPSSQYGVAVVSLVTKPSSTMLFGQGGSLETIISRSMATVAPWRLIATDESLDSELKKAEQNREATIVIVDASTLNGPRSKMMDTIDARVGGQTAFLFIQTDGAADGAAAPDSPEQMLRDWFPESMRKKCPCFGSVIKEADALQDALAVTATGLRAKLVNEDPAAKLTRDDLPDEDDGAAAAGVPIGTKPLIGGAGVKP